MRLKRCREIEICGKENAEFPRQRAAGAIPVLSAIGFCVVPTVNFAQQNLKAEARCDDALGGEQNNVQLWLYLQLEALKRHACALLLALFFRVKKSASAPAHDARKPAQKSAACAAPMMLFNFPSLQKRPFCRNRFGIRKRRAPKFRPTLRGSLLSRLRRSRQDRLFPVFL